MPLIVLFRYCSQMIITILSTILVLTMAGNRAVSSATVLAIFQKQALIEHNLQRQFQCTGP